MRKEERGKIKGKREEKEKGKKRERCRNEIYCSWLVGGNAGKN